MYYEIETKNGNRLVKDQDSGQFFYMSVSPDAYGYLRPSDEYEWQNAIYNWGKNVVTVYTSCPFVFSIKEAAVMLVYKVTNHGYSRKFVSAWALNLEDSEGPMPLHEALQYIVHLQSEAKKLRKDTSKLIQMMRGNAYDFEAMNVILRITGYQNRHGDIIAVTTRKDCGAVGIVHLNVGKYWNIDPELSCTTDDFAITLWPQIENNEGAIAGSIMLWEDQLETKPIIQAIDSQSGLVDMG